jgi:cobalamin biosynthesis protein CbiG
MIDVVLGIGCDRGTPLATLEAALDAATGDLGPVRIGCVASIDRKGDEPAILALAASRSVPLRLYTAEARFNDPSDSDETGSLRTPGSARPLAARASTPFLDPIQRSSGR